jgi:xylulokinase
MQAPGLSLRSLPRSVGILARSDSPAKCTVPYFSTRRDQGPAYGAALLAGVAAGAFESVNEACALIDVRSDICEPDPGRTRRYDDYYAAYQALYPATMPTMHTLSELAQR